MAGKRKKETLADANTRVVLAFGERLQEKLGDNPLSSLCRPTGLTYDSVLRLVRGNRSPSLKTAAKIATAFGETLSEFLR